MLYKFNRKSQVFIVVMFMIIAWYGQFLRFLVHTLIPLDIENNEKSGFLFVFLMMYYLTYAFIETPLCLYYYYSNWKNAFLKTNLFVILAALIGLFFEKQIQYYYFLSIVLAVYNSSMFVLVSYYYTQFFREKFIIFLNINFALGIGGWFGFPFSYFIDFQNLNKDTLVILIGLIPALWSIIWYFKPFLGENNPSSAKNRFMILTLTEILSDKSSKFVFISGFIQGFFNFFYYIQQSKLMSKYQGIPYSASMLNLISMIVAAIGAIIGIVLLRKAERKLDFRLLKHQYIIISVLIILSFLASIKLNTLGLYKYLYYMTLVTNIFFSSLLIYPFFVGYKLYQKHAVTWFTYYSASSFFGTAAIFFIVDFFSICQENQLYIYLTLGINIFVWTLIKEKVDTTEKGFNINAFS